MSFFSIRSLPKEGDVGYKSLKDYSDEELIWFLDHNTQIDLQKLSGITSEILRRMNHVKPLLEQ